LLTGVPVAADGPLAIPQGNLSAEQIQTLYRQILTRWSAEGAGQAADDLIALETAVVEDTDPRTRRALLKAEQSVIHEIGQVDLEVLVPIAMLHHETYRRHLERRERGRALAMAHTRQMARDLAVLYWEQSGSEGAGRVAGELLTSLGGMLQEHAQQLPAAELYHQAVQLDGKNETALLGLATIYEKNAQYETTVKTLRSLLAAEPSHAEGRLRLAVNLRRLGAKDADAEARRLLEALASSESSWVGPLAVQELARLLREGGTLDEAERILRAGVSRFPDDGRLAIQLAAVLDRKGSPKEAAALVDRVLGGPAGRNVSGRFLYNTVRQELFAPGRTFLTETSRSRLQMLSQALEETGS
jgi:tetratricopeptide (TPR) repeat protein